MFVSKYEVGRRRLIPRWPVRTSSLFYRIRVPGTKRSLLRFEGRYNPKTLQRELILKDKKPLFWMVGLFALAAIPIAVGQQLVFSIFGSICFFAAINVLWTLIIGTAGLQSYASLATVGVGAYAATYLSITYGIPWPIMLVVGTLFGALMGFIISVPARRLDGLYYALLTIGISEFLRSYITQSESLGGQFNGALFGADRIVSEEAMQTSSGQTISYLVSFFVLLISLAIFRLVSGGRIGILLRTAQASKEDESFAAAIGIDFQRARLVVFLIASAALGFVGAFYATNQGGASLSLFSLDQMLLLLAMIVIGGLGKAEGAVVGTVIVVFLNQWFTSWGPWRIVLVGFLMLASVLYTRNGLFGLRQQLIEIRERRKALSRATRTTRYGAFLPEQGPEISDKGVIAEREFERAIRDKLREWITPEIIEEHRLSPLGQHSDHLERILNYFRKQPISNKYVVYCESAFQAYRVVALSGIPGVPPRLVDDKTYSNLDEAYHAVFLRRINDLKSQH
jgi:branched-chain amino acid transport system permease protein